MAKRRISKASKRRLMFFGVISLAIIAYFFVSTFSYVLKIANLSSEKKNLELELSEKKENEEDLVNEIDRLKDPDYLARYARENYSYSKDGEYIIKIDKSNNKEINEEVKSYKNYIIYLCVFIIILILFYILRKGKRKKQNKEQKK